MHKVSSSEMKASLGSFAFSKSYFQQWFVGECVGCQHHKMVSTTSIIVDHPSSDADEQKGMKNEDCLLT